MQVVEHHSLEQLRSLARSDSDPKMVIRLHAIALAKNGKTAPQVAEEIGYSRRGVQFWVKWYNHGGIEELRNEGGQGRKPTLDESEQQQLKDRLDAGPLAPRRTVASARCAAWMCNASCRRSSARSAASAQSTTCCTRSATTIWFHARSTRTPIRRRRKLLKKHAAIDRADCTSAPGQTHRGLVPG